MSGFLEDIERRLKELRSGPSSLLEAQQFMEWAPHDIEWLISEVRRLRQKVHMYEDIRS